MGKDNFCNRFLSVPRHIRKSWCPVFRRCNFWRTYFLPVPGFIACPADIYFFYAGLSFLGPFWCFRGLRGRCFFEIGSFLRRITNLLLLGVSTLS